MLAADPVLAPASDLASHADPLIDDALGFTAAYQRHIGDAVPLRELRCLVHQFPRCLLPIEPGDRLAGRIRYPLVGVSPEPGGFGYYCQREAIEARLGGAAAGPRVVAMLEFWETERTAAKVRAAYPPDVASVLRSDAWTSEPGVAFPLYRMALAALDWDKLVRLGIVGLKREIRLAGSTPLHVAMDGALDLLASVCRWYARRTTDRPMAEALEAVAVRAPESLREGLQLVWLYALVGGVVNYGRMDVALGDLLARDLDSGRSTEDEALELLVSFWRLVIARKSTFNGRIVVGGRGRRNEAAADRFALLAMEATRRTRDIEPQLTLRFHAGQSPLLYAKALDLLGEGTTYPMLYNDDVNVPAVAHAFGVEQEVAEQYLPHGCGEYVIENVAYGSPNGVINLVQALSIALEGIQGFATFDDLFSAYGDVVAKHVQALARQEAIEYQVTGRELSMLYVSMLYDDCIGRGRALLDGGVVHLGGTLETYGNITVSDGLTAIETLVYQRGRISKEELESALSADFVGHEATRALLLAAPKYGNDDDRADRMARRVHEHVCRVIREQAKAVDLCSYLAVLVNNSANTILGRNTAASPDGRKSGASFSNANNPVAGADRSGTTAFLNSLVKLDPTAHAGAVQNMKLGREMFGAHKPVLEALLDVYFAKGGTQAMITVVGRGELEAALREPMSYQHLMVRVGGFSARFVDLPRDVQEDILCRTLN
jgi:pyruvate-formate lyase